MITNEKSRFELLREKAERLCEVNSVHPTEYVDFIPYEIIMESVLGPGSRDAVSFRATSVQGRVSDTEVLLNSEDVFFFDQWGMYILNSISKYDMGFTEHTFPDQDFFTKADLYQLDALYNGVLSFAVNNLIVLGGVKADRFRIFETERKIRRLGMSRMCDTEVVLILVGAKNNSFMLKLPVETNWSESGIRLRLRLRGVLARNVSSIV
jgi:hypothetical protein